MPVYNRKAHIGKTRTVKPCDGCGCVLPKGSMVMLWRIWIKGLQRKVRLCSRCQDVVYGCAGRAGLDCEHEFMVRELCESCDSFPVCSRVKYLREENPGEIWFGDVDGIGVRSGD